VLFKGLVVAKRVKNFLACYRTHKVIEPVVPVMSYLNSIHSLKVDSFKWRFNVYLFILSLPRYIFPQSCRLFSFPPIARHSIGIIIIIIMHSKTYAVPNYVIVLPFLRLWSKCCPQHPVLKHSVCLHFPGWELTELLFTPDTDEERTRLTNAFKAREAKTSRRRADLTTTRTFSQCRGQ